VPTKNETTAREFADAFNERDVDGLIERSAGDCVIVAQRSETEGAYTGHDGVRHWAQGYYELVPDVRIALDRVTELEDGRVLVLGRQSGTTAQGAQFDAPLALVGEFEAGLMRTLTAYPTRARALEAVGVVE
jgi:ketosteroid isomerase-like protein